MRSGDRVLWAIPYLAMIVGLHLLQSAWVSFAIYHGLVALAVARRPDLIGELVRGWHAGVGTGAIVFGLAGGVMLLLLAPAAGVDGGLIRPVLERLGLSGLGWTLFVIYHTLANPWFEEVLWRGRLGSDARTPTLGDALFAGYHLLVLMLFLSGAWLVLAFGVLVAAGWLWRQLRRQHGGLLLPVVSHLAADGSIMVVAWWLARPV